MPLYGHFNYVATPEKLYGMEPIDDHEYAAIVDMSTSPPELLVAYNLGDEKGSEVYRLPTRLQTADEAEDDEDEHDDEYQPEVHGTKFVAEMDKLSPEFRVSMLFNGIKRAFQVRDSEGFERLVVFQHITSPELN